MTRLKSKGTKLQVFSGKEANMNRVIAKILDGKDALIAYDIWIHIRRIKGFRHISARTVYRRLQALKKQGWIAEKGTRPTKPGWDSALYELTLRGKAALMLDEKSIEDFLHVSTEEQIQKFLEAFA